MNKSKSNLSAVLLAVVFGIVATTNQAATARAVVSPVDMRCEYLKNPLGIDVAQPRLNWRLESAKPSVRGQRQTAYQVLVASSEKVLRADQGDLWDSGKVMSDESVQITYSGKSLQSQEACW